MNLPLPEYRVIRLLRGSGHARVFEAVSERDGRRVVAKVYDIEHASVEDRVLHEFELIERLDIPGVVVARELRRAGDQLVLVLDHVPGVNLREYANGQALALSRFWPIALALADILAQTHACRVIHRDIKPTNIIVDEAGGVHLIDFGISVLLESERRHVYDVDVLAGTLPYVSPEQTGRTNRAVDLRSDLYSLGVTFYELLTGQRPFEDQAPLELIHAHLARTPAPPSRLRSSLPEPLSRLVMKLLEKAPEHRYQTAAGLAADLRTLRDLGEELEGRDADAEHAFVLGSADVSDRLALPHQLYGREVEQAALLRDYRAAVESRTTRASLVTGPVGIGKSALLRALELAVAEDSGLLARGSFAELRELPYAGFIDALTRLCEQLLTESDAGLVRWRSRLREGLGSLASVAVELIPRLALVLELELAPPLVLEPIEARNRMRLALERLIASLSDGERPLVLVLEDLDRADAPSLGLFESLLSARAGGGLMLVATLCDERLDPEGLLAKLITEVAAPTQRARRVRHTKLEPLTPASIQALLADTLGRPVTEVEPLARVFARKTGGVPLFVEQLLAELLERGALRPSPQGWRWDQAAVELAQIPDDAVQMMHAKFSALGVQARELLGRAACIGARFGIAQLATVSEAPRAELAASCFALLDHGVLSSVGPEFGFAHEGLRRAALAQLAPEQQRVVHWTLGRHLLETRASVDAQLFDIVDHLNAGIPAQLDEEQRLELAQLELRAGARALDSGAYEFALRYLDHGITLVAQWTPGVAERGPSSEHYALSFELHFARAQSLALAQSRDHANEAFDALLRWRLEDHHFGKVVARRCRILRENGCAREAVDLAFAAMARMGLDPGLLGNAGMRARALLGMLRTARRVRRLGREGLMALPACTDERTAALIEIVAEVKYSAFIVNPVVAIRVAAMHLDLICRHGFHPSACGALADLALGVSGALNRPADGVEMIETALALCERTPNPARTRLAVIAPGLTLVLHRGRSFAEVSAIVDDSYPRALELGEFGAANFLAMRACHFPMEIGTHSSVVERRCAELRADLDRWGTRQAATLVWLLHCWYVTLLGQAAGSDGGCGGSSTRGGLVDARDIDAEMVLARGGTATTVCISAVNRAIVLLLFGDSRAAMAAALGVVGTVERLALNASLIPQAALVMVVAVDRLRVSGEQPPGPALAAARKGLRLLRRWAKTGRDSYGHYAELALGMRAAASGHFDQAAKHLERAWTGARYQGCRWVEALSAECTAELLDQRGLTLLAEGAWRRTWDAYALWGAAAKLELLRAAKPTLFVELARAESSSEQLERSSDMRSEHGPGTRPGTRSGPGTLDLDGVLQSVGELSEDLGLEQVSCRALDAAMTSAGADHGMLLLERDGELALVAHASSATAATMFADAPALRDASERAPATLINFVARTHQWLVLDDAREDPRFAADPYLQAHASRSILALPILKRERRVGVLVLENRLTSHGFTPAIIETLRLIMDAAARILDNARLHAALGRSEARWRSLVDSAPDVIALLDERGEIALLNRGGPFASVAAGGSTRAGSLTKASTLSWREAVARVLDHGHAQQLELEFTTPEGATSWYEARLAPIELAPSFVAPEPEPRPVRRNAVVVATDVSARKQADADKQLLEAQLRQQQRLDSIGTLASGVAHEINNPIQGIMNYAELIGQSSHKPEVVEEFASEITHESDRVATIVRNLLAFSRQERDEQRELVEVSGVIEATLSLIRSILRKDHITLVLELGAGTPRVYCQIQAIQQIIMNLVTNARDALNERYTGYDARKRIFVRVERLDTEANEARVRVVVEDTGSGIEADVLARIFDPFFTTKTRDQGTGLGLSVSHGIALDHGGELSVETTLGVGTRFYLDLPLVE
ncbi:Sensory box histidine kinase/response regulator [Enhygromyxa salina]|uniref:histidine kinase n=1 Tax=Enhygromyxa salina TaxID=215803 RepID=A0A0C1ZTN1_9BACT|nr:AAA family ATPase [Enhygromyxa salina]KIG14413.1 Sensory box histidine kinase/response regulator [Enhygromyxa salina]